MSDKWYYDWNGKSILIVEDDHLCFSYLDALLKPTKATVYHASSGEAALELCRNLTFVNIVLMDIRLPGITGFETTQHLKKIHRDLPVIAQTAYAHECDRETALAAGCCDFIAKPIRANEIFDMIRKYI